MIVTISTTHQPTSDFTYLLHKHPDRFQTKDISFGKAHVFYPAFSEKEATMALLLDINAVDLSRRTQQNYAQSFQLDHYVNTRPYVSSSFLSTALSKVLGSALNGTCKDRPEIVHKALPLVVRLDTLSAKGGEAQIRRLFEPLGYELQLTPLPLDEQFPEWGLSTFYSLELKNTLPLQQLLQHLFVLLPVLDNNKHYFVNESEIEKLLSKGENWLDTHPEKEYITKRYLKYKKSYYQKALTELNPEESASIKNAEKEKLPSLHDQRHEMVADELKTRGIKSVIDLGCGSGKLLRHLIKMPQLEKIGGLEVSFRELEATKKRIYYENMSPKSQERLQLFQGALTYKDERIQSYEAGVLVEVIEHLDPSRLEALETVVFEYGNLSTIIITTPNREYNVLFENLPQDKFRHPDHRFEWTRKEFQDWGNTLAQKFDYEVDYQAIGEEHPLHGGPSQVAIFTKNAKPQAKQNK